MSSRPFANISLLLVLILAVLILIFVPGASDTARSFFSPETALILTILGGLATLVYLGGKAIKWLFTETDIKHSAPTGENLSNSTDEQPGNKAEKPANVPMRRPKIKGSDPHSVQLERPRSTSDSAGTQRPVGTQQIGVGRLKALVQDRNGQPVIGVDVLLGFENGTHHHTTTDGSGVADFPSPHRWPVTILSARDGFKAYIQVHYEPVDTLQITLTRAEATGAIICTGGTGYVPGLQGRLAPILDELNRTYIYAGNIAVDGGKNQPVRFKLGEPFEVEDSVGHRFQLTVLTFIGRTSIVEYVDLGIEVVLSRPC